MPQTPLYAVLKPSVILAKNDVIFPVISLLLFRDFPQTMLGIKNIRYSIKTLVI